ncbi:MAG: hypothetical protein WCP32_11875 [Bacteroidota bacterium]
MKNNMNIPIIDGFNVEGVCRENSYYVRFNDEDIEDLLHYGFDLNYLLEPELTATDPEHPIRFKITSKDNPAVYGWVSKVIEKTNDQWQTKFLYGFYRHGLFRIKYPITFNVNSNQMRGILKRNAGKNENQTAYFRTIFGIFDLEPEIKPLDFIFSWMHGLKINHI